ncbi:potassium channel family protein [Rhodococcus sp. NPDC057529]|uniref:potassium channel family protein n=1 Tax=Rhodococcus sp. NPDC057529 TaxID=3346158 RepID=UPI0036731953
MSMFVVIGDTGAARQTCATLTGQGHRVHHLDRPDDDTLRTACTGTVAGIAVLVHDDVMALRYALAAAHIDDTIPIITSVFDRTIADQLTSLLPHCEAVSPADLAAPALAGPCVNAEWLAARARRGVVSAAYLGDTGPAALAFPVETRPLRSQFTDKLLGVLRPLDIGTRILFGGFAGLNAILVLDWLWLTLAGHPVLVSLHEAVRVVTTVGPASADHATAAYSLFGCLAMLMAVVFTAMFTAGVVDRLLSPRLAGMIGRRTLPRSHHVIVVGLGQVGLRLCRELQALGVPVIAIERNKDAPNLRLVRQLNIPTVVGHGGDRNLLERLGIHHARALAAVGSDELGNLAVTVAAQRVAPRVRVILRAGEQEAISETRSLLPLGIVRDVNSLSAAYVVARLLGIPVDAVVTDGATPFLKIAGTGFVEMRVLTGLHCTRTGPDHPRRSIETSAAPPATSARQPTATRN